MNNKQVIRSLIFVFILWGATIADIASASVPGKTEKGTGYFNIAEKGTGYFNIVGSILI